MSENKTLLVEQTITINRPIDDVFAFLCNHENYAHWFPNVVSVESANTLPHGTVGKEYHETLRLPSGRQKSISIVVVESVRPTVFVTEGRFPPLHPRSEFRLTRQSESETIVDWRFFSRNRFALLRTMLKIVLRKSLSRQARLGLSRVASLLEKPGSHATRRSSSN